MFLLPFGVLESFGTIPDKIHEHAKHLLAIRNYVEIGGDRIEKSDLAARFEPDQLNHLPGQPPQRKPRGFWRIVDGPPIGQCRLAEADRAIEGGDEFRRKALRERVVDIAESVR